MSIQFIPVVEEPKKVLKFKDVPINQFFVLNRNLCQKVNCESFTIIAKGPDREPYAYYHDGVPEHTEIEKIILIQHIDY